jgi:hypothetical protein
MDAVTEKFRAYAQEFGAIEMDDRAESYQCNYFRDVLSRIIDNPSVTQQPLDNNDARMCKV